MKCKHCGLEIEQTSYGMWRHTGYPMTKRVTIHCISTSTVAEPLTKEDRFRNLMKEYEKIQGR